MTYPINEQVFVDVWMKNLDNLDDTDKEFARAVAAALNGAYRIGLEDGKAEVVKCRNVD